MEQYFSGRSVMTVAEIKQDNSERIENKVFVNETVDSLWNKAHLRVYRSTFAEMGFRDSRFHQCDLSFCVFIDCYFKKTFFEQTKFISCVFINCNFDMAVFIDCDFRYATFNDCYISYKQLKNSLPHNQENLCADICRNLSLQCLKKGAIEDYKAYLFEERNAGEIHSIRKLFHHKNTYYDKYGFLDGLRGLFDYLRSKLSKFLWGYGERMGVLIRNIVLIVLLYGFFYLVNYDCIAQAGESRNPFLWAMYLSACQFFSAMSPDETQNFFLHIIELSEHIIGLVLMGFLGAALFRQINRR